MLTAMIFRIAIQFTWGLGLIVAAFVLGKKADDPLPWAVGVLGAIVIAGTLLAAMAEQNSALTSSSTDRKPGATGTT